MSHWRLDWPTSGGVRLAHAQLKVSPADFFVDEVLDLAGELTAPEPTEVRGRGEHLCLRLEKVGDNTEFVARELAHLTHCRSFDVGFCGLKDRHAVTRQWFSLYRPGREAEDADLLQEVSSRWSVVSSFRDARKLRRGDHWGNRFVITLRNVSGDRQAIENALQRLATVGAPNYFGPQRFGRDGANLDRALHTDPSVLNRRSRSGGKGRGGKKRAGSEGAKNVLYFSAARSWLFNEVLAARVQDGSWAEASATGPLWGDGGTTATGPLEALERGIVSQTPGLADLFSVTRMKPERRPLAARPEDLVWHWQGDDCLELAFLLSPGQYATTILNDIFELEDMSLGRHNEQQG
ncbi:tRNA pseudouridine(13) synthase TruD [Marinobacter sp. Arc7-DN-1]|uniref:tRNA pseudouridine(13) synthase TruD n=1 Tax=Marinobacter sp. Arc7-DN-1 TaxID=2304594 RepID=UPI000E430871|nr:tRNA pseudouridine(13) synthase TruD [Marinobacter sp. Arc7-DN-1]AXS85062.1 tRNA pseudouridine(13) synthase TruD [Marinobacter sp. Arc7-DN-1]